MELTCFSTAREMAAAVATRAVSARELLELHVARIEEVNATVNALVSLDVERARHAARAADEATASGAALGPLHGLPFAFKDTHEARGWPTTFGSPLFAGHVSEHDDLVVARIRAAGAVVVGKTNVPEFAAGSHTFNPVFGTTRNPYDPSRSAGGSSGGAAAALATGMVPLAEGSDMGGSLRNPASFCNVVGLRPSPGRVPTWPTDNALETLSVPGPMARDVADVALLLSVVAGPHPALPLSLAEPGEVFRVPLSGELTGLRVALSADLGGALAVDRVVAALVRGQGDLLTGAGAVVVEAAPDLAGADEAFRTLRAWIFRHRFGALLAAHPEALKPSLAHNIRAGESLSGEDVARAFEQRTRIGERVAAFFAEHDVLVLPTSQVPPFPADHEYPTVVAGRPQADYLDWMRAAYLITVTGCPAVSVPAGFTEEGLPVGVQIVAAPNRDRRLLEVAHAFEQLTRAGSRHPAR